MKQGGLSWKKTGEIYVVFADISTEGLVPTRLALTLKLRSSTCQETILAMCINLRSTP